jgi:hypothetical protein
LLFNTDNYLREDLLLLPDDFDFSLPPELPEELLPPLLLRPEELTPDEDDCLEEPFETLLRSDDPPEPDRADTVFDDRRVETVVLSDEGLETDLFVTLLFDLRVTTVVPSFDGFDTDLFVTVLFDLRVTTVVPSFDGFDTDLFVTVVAERLVVLFPTGRPSVTETDDDLLFELSIADSPATLLLCSG